MTPADLCKTLRISRSQRLAQSTLHALAYLIEQGGSARMADIADELDVSTPCITGTVDALEKLGYARRVHSTQDRRAIHIHITPKGTAALDACLGTAPAFGLRHIRRLFPLIRVHP